jgi:PHD/YefM family antitoxin component YafN of YafNO toxin-antitoxin module
MRTITESDARAVLHELLDEAPGFSEPVLITGKSANGVLVPEDQWLGIQETLHLLSIPGVRESIMNGIETPLDRCEETPGW